MVEGLQLISFSYFDDFKKGIENSFSINQLQEKNTKEITAEDFEHYLISSSLYSSKIEGNSLDVNSFFRNRGNTDTPKIKEVEEIENLVKAYRFATENALSEANFLHTHFLLSHTLLPKKEQGKYRTEQVGIRDSGTMKLIYLAVEPEYVSTEVKKLFVDIQILLKQDQSEAEVFYTASILHLWLAKIHPFGDGNGRAARLLEKWFLASKLGQNAWSIPSEKYYWDNRSAYYQHIALGFNYYALHWERCLSFLEMLPKSVNQLPIV